MFLFLCFLLSSVFQCLNYLDPLVFRVRKETKAFRVNQEFPLSLQDLLEPMDGQGPEDLQDLKEHVCCIKMMGKFYLTKWFRFYLISADH